MEIAFVLCWAGWIVTIYLARRERRELLNRLMARDYHEFSTLEHTGPPKGRENWLEQSIKKAYKRRAKEVLEEPDE